MTKTAGQELAATLRKVCRIGTRTRRHRDNTDLHKRMIEVIYDAHAYPGYYTGDTNKALSAAWGVYCSWSKHVDGHRISGVLTWKISTMTPWQLANLLGQMVDANVQTTGDGERFFANLARKLAA